MDKAAGETRQIESTLSEAVLNGALRSCAQRIQSLLFALNDMARRHQPLVHLREPQLFARQAGAGGGVQALRQCEFSASCRRRGCFGRMHQPSGQVIQPLHFAVLFAGKLLLKLASQLSQLQQQFRRTGLTSSAAAVGGGRAQVGGKIGQS